MSNNTGLWPNISARHMDLSAASCPVWYFNPAGTGTGDGSASAPFKNLSEIRRWLPLGIVLNQSTRFEFAGDYSTSTDPLFLDLKMRGTDYVHFKGTGQTTAQSGTLSAKTDLVSGTNNADVTGNSGIASYVGKRMRITQAGGTLGRFAWLAKDLTGDKVRMSNWTAPIMVSAAFSGIPTANVAPGATDTYVIETLTKLDYVNVRVASGSPAFAGSPNLNACFVEDLDLGLTTGTGGPIFQVANGVQAVYVGCAVGTLYYSGGSGACVSIYANCRSRHNSTIFEGVHYYLAGLTLGSGTAMNVQNPQGVVFDQNHLMQSNRVLVRRSGHTRIGTMSIMDATGAALTLDPSGMDCTIQNQFDGAHLLWGSGGSTYGVTVGSGKGLFYASTKPTINGGSGDAQIGVAGNVAWGSVPAVHANGAQISVLF